jgi:hypothetical protein
MEQIRYKCLLINKAKGFQLPYFLKHFISTGITRICRHDCQRLHVASTGDNTLKFDHLANMFSPNLSNRNGSHLISRFKGKSAATDGSVSLVPQTAHLLVSGQSSREWILCYCRSILFPLLFLADLFISARSLVKQDLEW